MSESEHWFSLVHCIRPRMEFAQFLRSHEDKQNKPVDKSTIALLDGMMRAGKYPERVRKFLRVTFKAIENELIDPYLKAHPPEVTNGWGVPSGAFTFFSGEAKQAFTYFINWDKPSDVVQQKINPGFFDYCQQKQRYPCAEGGCEVSEISYIYSCSKLRDCLGKFLDNLHYSCSRLIERKVPVRASLALNLESLNKIASNRSEAKRVYDELNRFVAAAPEYPLFQGDVICPPRRLSEVLSNYSSNLSQDTREWVVNIYEQIIKSPLFSIPDNPAFLEITQASRRLHIRNLRWLASKDQETGHPYSLQEFIQLALALAIISRAPRFYLLHLGPAVAGEKYEDIDLPFGTGTLVMNSVDLCDELLGYINILAETAISSLARTEAFVLQVRYETTKRNLQLAESAYGVGHTQKDRFTSMLNHLEFAEGKLMPDHLNVDEALARVIKARKCGRKAVASSKTMDFMANLFQVNRRVEEVNTRWFVGGTYDVADHIRSEINTFEEVLNVDLTQVEGVLIPENLTGGKGRLYDEFYDDIVHEIISNAVRRGAVSFDVTFTTIKVWRDTSLDDYDSLVFTNSTTADNFEERLGLTLGQWSEWPISDELKGALRQIAIRLKATKQGLLFAKPERNANEWLFSVALHIVGMRKHKEM